MFQGSGVEGQDIRGGFTNAQRPPPVGANDLRQFADQGEPKIFSEQVQYIFELEIIFRKFTSKMLTRFYKWVSSGLRRRPRVFDKYSCFSQRCGWTTTAAAAAATSTPAAAHVLRYEHGRDGSGTENGCRRADDGRPSTAHDGPYAATGHAATTGASQRNHFDGPLAAAATLPDGNRRHGRTGTTAPAPAKCKSRC